ncbi:hypothetical protein FJY70_05640, partial [candidate division WOR-3 bacterium]|nr:hypothetical protein [candidate division WOR-3 bacterium]
MRWRQWTILRKEPPSRFCVALGNDYSGLKLAHFVYGNGAENTNGQALVITKIAGTTTPPTETLVSGMPDSTDRVLHAGPAHYQIAGYTYATGVYQHRDSEGRVLLYAGGLRVQSGSTAVEFDGQFCQYPLPDSGRDWRPPMLWFDNSQAVYRLLTCCCWLDRDRLVTDFASTSLYAQAYIHHDFARDRRSIGQVLAEAQRSFWLYLRLGSLDPCNDADDVRVVSRHYWTPPELGGLGPDEVARNPRVDGCEYYDGATADVGGQRVTCGSVGVGRTVYQVGGEFLTPAWARVITKEISTRYPRRSSLYPYGRRRFLPAVRAVDTGAAEQPPTQYDFLKRCAVSFLSGLSVDAVIAGVGVSRSTLLYPCALLELYVSPISGQADGVIWTKDEPAEDVVVQAFPTFEPIAAAEVVAATKTLTGWNCTHVISAVTQSNPADGPCAWALKVWVPFGLNLAGYAYKLTEGGADEDGGLALELWTDHGNRPDEAVPGTRALRIGHDTLSAGLQYAGLWDEDHEDPDMRTAIAPGTYWVVCVIDRQDAGPVPIVAPPISWADALAVAVDCGYRLSF